MKGKIDKNEIDSEKMTKEKPNLNMQKRHKLVRKENVQRARKVLVQSKKFE